MSKPANASPVAPNSTNVQVEFGARSANGGPLSGLGSLIGPPSAPQFSQSTTGGSIAAGTYYGCCTYYNGTGQESAPSPVTTISVASGTTNSALAYVNYIPPTANGVRFYLGTTNTPASMFLAGSITSQSQQYAVTSIPTTGSAPPSSGTAGPAGLTISYRVEGGADTALTPSFGTGTFGTYVSSGSLGESGVTPGKYTLDTPNTIWSSGAPSVTFTLQGVYGMSVERFTIPIGASSVVGSVTVGTNNDKTGYSLTQAFPTNFSSLAITAGGAVTAGTVSDKTGYSLATTQTFSTSGSVGSVNGNVTGSVASVTANVNAVLANAAHGGAAATLQLGGAGGLTGNVTGNLSGSVGSVTGNVGGNVVGSVASVTAAVNINLAQAGLTPRALDAVADASLTVGDALVSALCGVAGKESVSGTTYVIQTPNTGTTIRTFTLNSSTNPTSRS